MDFIEHLSMILSERSKFKCPEHLVGLLVRHSISVAISVVMAILSYAPAPGMHFVVTLLSLSAAASGKSDEPQPSSVIAHIKADGVFSSLLASSGSLGACAVLRENSEVDDTLSICRWSEGRMTELTKLDTRFRIRILDHIVIDNQSYLLYSSHHDQTSNEVSIQMCVFDHNDNSCNWLDLDIVPHVLAGRLSKHGDLSVVAAYSLKDVDNESICRNIEVGRTEFIENKRSSHKSNSPWLIRGADAVFELDRRRNDTWVVKSFDETIHEIELAFEPIEVIGDTDGVSEVMIGRLEDGQLQILRLTDAGDIDKLGPFNSQWQSNHILRGGRMLSDTRCLMVTSGLSQEKIFERVEKAGRQVVENKFRLSRASVFLNTICIQQFGQEFLYSELSKVYRIVMF